MALDALTDPIKAVIYKKTLNNDQVVYVPYLPRTDAEWVSLNGTITIHGTTEAANTDLETIIKALNSSIGAPGAAASSSTSDSLQAQINYISAELISKSGAFVYKGSTSAQSTAETPLVFCVRVLGQGTVPAAGWVFNISNNFKIDSNGRLIASTDGDAYKGGTNIVIIGDGTSGDPFRFDALGGDMGNHALTSEAIGSASLNGSTITFTYVDGSTAGTITFSTIGTTAVGTVGIAATSASIVSGSSQLVTAGAVYDFASTAGKINTTATNDNATYYLTFVDGSGDGKTVYVDPTTNPLSYNPSTNTINANISGNAATATTANNANIATLAESLRSSLSIFGQSYDGSTAKTIKAGQGLSVSTPAGSTTTTISVGAGNGIVVNASSIAVAAKTGGAISVTDQGVDIVEINTITADAVYSAVQVDKYGRAKAGAQSIIFAKGINDPDLGDLVIGGLAFIGTSTAAASTYTGNAISSGNIGIMDDAE